MSSPSGPRPLSETIRRKMIAQKTRDTAPELLLRRALHARGLRYRLGVKVPGAQRRTIDIAFTKTKVVVMVDGCFWHGCPAHAIPPKNNRDWWLEKLTRNRKRDQETNELLKGSGWKVVRVWEHEPLEDAVSRVLSALTETAKANQAGRSHS